MIRTSFATFAAIVLSIVVSTNAAVVTVYGVQAPITTPTVTASQPPRASIDWAGTETAFAIGPGESGLTKYEVHYIQSKFVLHRSGVEPVTLISEPVTATFTHEQGGNILLMKGDPVVYTEPNGRNLEETGADIECELDSERKTGVCHGEHLHPFLTEIESGTQTLTQTVTRTEATTYTGSVFPIATLTTSGSKRSASVTTGSTAFWLATLALGAVVTF